MHKRLLKISTGFLYLLFSMHAISATDDQSVKKISTQDQQCILKQVDLMEQKINLIAKHMGKAIKPFTTFNCVSCSDNVIKFLITPINMQINQLISSTLNDETETSFIPTPSYTQDSKACSTLKSGNSKLNIVLNKFKKNGTLFFEQKNMSDYRPNSISNRLLDLSGHINQLLSIRINPGIVYNNINYAIRYAEIIYKDKKNNAVIPEEDKHLPYISEKQVFMQIMSIMNNIQLFAKKNNIALPKINIHLHHLSDVTSFDTYLLSQIMLTELQIITTNITKSDIDFFYYPAGYKLPADNYQRLSILNKIINEILVLDNQ